MAALPCPVWSPCQVREPFSKAPAVQHHLEHHRRAQSDSQFSALDWDTHSRTENHSLASGLQPGHWNLSSPQACSLPWPTSRLGSENHSLEELAPTKGRDRLFSAQHVPPPPTRLKPLLAQRTILQQLCFNQERCWPPTSPIPSNFSPIEVAPGPENHSPSCCYSSLSVQSSLPVDTRVDAALCVNHSDPPGTYSFFP